MSSLVISFVLWGHCSVAKLRLTLIWPINCSPPGSSVHEISQTRILEWVAISFSKGSSQPRDWTWVSCIAGRFFTAEPPGKPLSSLRNVISRTSIVCIAEHEFASCFWRSRVGVTLMDFVGIFRIKKPCSSTSNAECECIPGFHCEGAGCSMCEKDCKQGQELTNEGKFPLVGCKFVI